MTPPSHSPVTPQQHTPHSHDGSGGLIEASTAFTVDGARAARWYAGSRDSDADARGNDEPS